MACLSFNFSQYWKKNSVVWSTSTTLQLLALSWRVTTWYTQGMVTIIRRYGLCFPKQVRRAQVDSIEEARYWFLVYQDSSKYKSGRASYQGLRTVKTGSIIAPHCGLPPSKFIHGNTVNHSCAFLCPVSKAGWLERAFENRASDYFRIPLCHQLNRFK
jgi:hypothetical protein